MHNHARISQSSQPLAPAKPLVQRRYRLMSSGLILMLLVGAAFRPVQASTSTQIDDPDWTSPRYSLFVEFEKKPETICPGDEVVIFTYLYVWDIPPSQRALHQGPNVAGYHRAGVEIMVRGEAYGTVSPRTSVTHMVETPDAIAPIAPFLYTAKEPGLEQLTFDAGPPAPAGTEATIEFKVEDCEPLVAMIYRGTLNAGFQVTYSGVLDPTRLNQDGENQYRAAAPFQLAESFAIPGVGCSVVGSIASSQADIDAVSQDQTTRFTITFQPTDHTVNVRCPGGGAAATGHWGAENLGPIEVTTPIAGGVARFNESHTAYRGEYTVIVERVVNESEATIPGTVVLAVRP